MADDKSPLEKLNENIAALSVMRDGDQVPVQLASLLALINNVDEEQMRKDLAGAVMVKVDDPDNPGKQIKKQKYADDDGEIVGVALREDIVVEAKGDKSAVTVGELIDASIAPHTAMAKLLDQYIKLALEERLGSSDSSG